MMIVVVFMMYLARNKLDLRNQNSLTYPKIKWNIQ